MSEMQQVKELMWMEYRSISYKNVLSFLFLSAVFILFVGWFLFSGDFKIVGGTMPAQFLADFALIFYASYIVYSLRSNAFKMQILKGDLYVTPFLIMLKTMPFSEKVIMRSRIYSFIILSVLINTIHFLIIYFISPNIQEFITATMLPIWLVLWNVIMFLIGMYIPMAEPGKVYSKLSLVKFSITYFPIVLLGIFLLIKFTGHGIFTGMVYLCTNYPLLTLLASLIIGAISIFLTFYYMKQYMAKVDYHV